MHYQSISIRDLLLSLGALPEPVLESPGHGLHVAHPTCTDSAAALGLLAPIELSHPGVGVPARGAPLLLDMEAHFPAPATRGMGLVVPLTEGRCTFRL